ncbi:MAG: hypothetical protein NW224_29915 [Leptolyngbyaceae cyanobacterium bins.302]|nr:hypothetical protein [Leptolyngbyaceae cyanobacterium bins.302]
MPMMRVTAPQGALNFAQKKSLSEAFTDLLLIGEVGTTAPEARKFVHILFQELDTLTDWFVGGHPRGLEPQGAPPHFFLDVFYPHAAAPPSAKRQLHRALNNALVRVVLGEDTPPDALSNWIVIHEIDEGAWGVRGNSIGVTDIFRANQASSDRLAYTTAFLAAETKLQTEFQFPRDLA